MMDTANYIFVLLILTASDKQTLKIEVQNKRSKHLFHNVLSKSNLQESGFASQQSLQDIKKMIQLAFSKEESLTVTIS